MDVFIHTAIQQLARPYPHDLIQAARLGISISRIGADIAHMSLEVVSDRDLGCQYSGLGDIKKYIQNENTASNNWALLSNNWGVIQ